MSDALDGTTPQRIGDAAGRLHSRSRAASAFVVLLGLSFVPDVHGQASDAPQVSTQPAGALTRKAPYRVIYDPLAGSIELQNQRGDVRERWPQFSAIAPLANIPADRPVSVEVINANPLLYDYTVRAEVVRQEDVKSCTEIGSRFLSQGFLLSSAAVSGSPNSSPDIPAISTGFLDVRSAFAATLGTRGSTRLTEDGLERELARIRADVNAFTEFTAMLVALARTVNDSIALFAAKGESVPLDTLLGRFQQSLEAIQPGLSDPAQTPILIEQRTSAAAAAVTTLKDLARSIETGNYTGTRADLAAQEVLLLDRRVDERASQLEATYPRLQRDLLRIARVRAQTRRIFTIGESGGVVRRLVIDSKSNGSYEDVLRLREGEVEFFTRPRMGLLCEISLGLSWLEPLATYAFDSDGRLIDSSTEDRRVAPAIMIHLSMSSLPVLGLTMGVGVGENSAPDLYLGGTLRMFEPIMLNMGWVWQRTPQLPGGMQLGQIVTNPSPTLLADLDLKFEPTIYFGIGIGR